MTSLKSKLFFRGEFVGISLPALMRQARENDMISTKVNFSEYAERFDTYYEALKAAEKEGYTINKYACCVSGPSSDDLDPATADEIAEEDPNLIWLGRV